MMRGIAMKKHITLKTLGILLYLPCFLVFTNCAPQSRMGMVVDPETGLQMGSVTSKNIVADSGQFENRKVKLNIRNTSGEAVFNLYNFRNNLEQSLSMKGYQPTKDDDFGVLIDVNVRYSGQATQDRAKEFGLLGAAGGGLAGYDRRRDFVGTGAGILVGATIGAVVGSFVRDETYLIIADVAVGIIDPRRGSTSKTIIMDSSPLMKDEQEIRTGIRPFNQRLETQIAVYAGGRNASQNTIAEAVRQRFLRILLDII
jgi:hypothetical protein